MLKHNNTTLPEEGLYCIRFHSFYPFHGSDGYLHLCDAKDMKLQSALKEFRYNCLFWAEKSCFHFSEYADMKIIKLNKLQTFLKTCPQMSPTIFDYWQWESVFDWDPFDKFQHFLTTRIWYFVNKPPFSETPSFSVNLSLPKI